MVFNLSSGQGTHVQNPNICPYCHVASEPTNFSYSHDPKANTFLSIWRCNFAECKRIYAVSHKYAQGESPIDRYLNGLPKGPIWPKPISDLKDGKTIGTETPADSNFIKTYLQSLEAEAHGYDEIAGMGYRKAIEYLVKDWAIQTNPEAKDKILTLWLSGIISEFYSGDLKDILDRATWLGNDQSHYNKLFDEYNINHLKELIDLIMVELDREFKKRHYIETIEKRK